MAERNGFSMNMIPGTALPLYCSKTPMFKSLVKRFKEYAMKTLVPLLLQLLLYVNGLAQSAGYDKIIRIDPATSMGGTVSDIFEEVRFIPLETTKESLFSRIGDMQVTDRYFIIYDHNGNNVVIYTKE